MAEQELPDPELLRKLLTYEPETGNLVWLPRWPDLFGDGARPAQHRANIWNGRLAGKNAGAVASDGYVRIAVFNTKMLAHRVALAMVLGRWPTEVDHINGKRDDNRLANLREVTRTENNMNSRRQRNNRSGATGVLWCQQTERWAVRIKKDGRSHYLGRYDTYGDAVTARKAAEKLLGFHKNHGRE